jgi:hypothetical protein
MYPHTDMIKAFCFGTSRNTAYSRCNGAGISKAVDYISEHFVDIPADIMATFAGIADYYISKPLDDLYDDVYDALTALGSLCVVLYGEPHYHQLITIINSLMLFGENTTLFDQVFDN